MAELQVATSTTCRLSVASLAAVVQMEYPLQDGSLQVMFVGAHNSIYNASYPLSPFIRPFIWGYKAI